MVSGVVCILHGLSSHPSRMVPRPVMGFYFLLLDQVTDEGASFLSGRGVEWKPVARKKLPEFSRRFPLCSISILWLPSLRSVTRDGG